MHDTNQFTALAAIERWRFSSLCEFDRHGFTVHTRTVMIRFSSDNHTSQETDFVRCFNATTQTSRFFQLATTLTGSTLLQLSTNECSFQRPEDTFMARPDPTPQCRSLPSHSLSRAGQIHGPLSLTLAGSRPIHQTARAIQYRMVPNMTISLNNFELCLHHTQLGVIE